MSRSTSTSQALRTVGCCWLHARWAKGSRPGTARAEPSWVAPCPGCTSSAEPFSAASLGLSLGVAGGEGSGLLRSEVFELLPVFLGHRGSEVDGELLFPDWPSLCGEPRGGSLRAGISAPTAGQDRGGTGAPWLWLVTPLPGATHSPGSLRRLGHMAVPSVSTPIAPGGPLVGTQVALCVP